MHHELRIANGAEAITPTRKRIRELAERTSNGTLMRLFWLQGTRELWVEICEPGLDRPIVIPAEPERALETFHHPYAYATVNGVVSLTAEPLAGYDSSCRSRPDCVA